MYGYEVLIEIQPQQILQKVTETQIFEMILHEEIDFSARYRSPVRKDDSPGCRFETSPDGVLLFVDFGETTGKTHRSCFKMVMDRYGCTFNQALKVICKHFGLSEVTEDYEPIEKKERTIEVTPHFDTIIECETKIAEKRDKIFWSQYLIKPEHLIEDKTGIVSKVTIHSSKKKTSFTPMGLCYSFDFGNHVKIYQPYNHPDYKWITNCNENDIGNINNLPIRGKEVIIQKSYKDHRVMRNIDFGLNVIWTQNEGCIPDLRILYDLTIRFDLITIFYDNDQAGRDAAAKLMNVILTVNPQAKVRCVWLPVRKFPHKDPGEFVSKEGRQDFQEVLQYIGIKPNK